MTQIPAKSKLSLHMSMFSIFYKTAKRPSELARLVAEEEEKKKLREDRREWAIEQANFACEGCSIDDIMRAAKRFYFEAFGEEWSE